MATTGWYVVIAYSGSQQPYPLKLPVAHAQQAAAQHQVSIANPVDHPGPYPTKAAAQAAIGGSSGGSSGSGGSSPPSQPQAQWWVVNVPASHVTPFIPEHSKSKPSLSVAGPFATRAQAEAWIATRESKFPSLPNPLTGIDAVGHFFNDLGKTSTWLRVGKVLLGATLVIVGVVQLTHAQNIIKQAAKKVPVIPV